MDIKYLRDVTSPPSQVGKAGDIKNVDRHIADRLIAGGFAAQVTGGKKEQPKNEHT